MVDPDILLYNGTFITLDPALPKASALAIQGERIIWLGDQKEADSWKGPHTQVIDLKGAFAYPGFIDTHAHVTYTGMTKNYLQLMGKNKETILKEVEEKVKNCKENEWIIGVG